MPEKRQVNGWVGFKLGLELRTVRERDARVPACRPSCWHVFVLSRLRWGKIGKARDVVPGNFS